MSSSLPPTFRTEAVVAASGPGRRGGWGAGGEGREVRRRGAAVQMTVTMVVDVPVLFDKFPQS